MTPPLPRTSPEAQGLSSRAVLAWLDALAEGGLELHSFMLLRAGAVVAEGHWAPYTPARVHHLYSLSKSVTAMAVGCLVADGRVQVEDRLVDHFPDALPETVSPHLAAMRIEDLLTMRSGHAEDITGALMAAQDGDWVRAFLAQPVAHPPGTGFVYNSAATFMLSALVQRLSGQPLLDFLRPRLLGPLGIEEARWAANGQGIHLGGWGLHLTTEGIARFGQFCLQRGEWAGQALLPAAWVDAAVRAHVPPGDDPGSDWAQGYGYQFWRCRHGAYRADGALGQFCIVMPREGAVLAITANVADMQRVLDHVWTHLRGDMGAGACPEDPTALAALRARCEGLHLPLPAPGAPGPTAPQEATYVFEANDLGLTACWVVLGPGGGTLTFADERGKHPVSVGWLDWHEGRTTAWPVSEEPMLGRAVPTRDGGQLVTLLWPEAGFHWSVTVNEAAGTLTLMPPATMGFADRPLRAVRADVLA
ncbi:serine hydrolase domain-containing protein [Deinococcus multiflagellatus]|uniref:Serine hydrolase domain-containing protein n=1 Tax=Deinococcus multiflagellatus TaxID=1656887 RepID=A0ABW1ZDV5_9DEIO|nr:serine hydrolase [Deinococcus multiflagellatus]MBZ9712716.1 beta-lactamase family protein [Deinococcus multiflagellatus]